MDSNLTPGVEAVHSATAAGMTKSGSDFYAFLVVILLLGGFALWLWFKSSQAKNSKPSHSEESHDRANDLKALEGLLSQLLTTQSKSLESMMDSKLKSIRDSQEASIKALEHKVDTNQRQEDDRLTRIERTVTEGFRAVHDRLDRHIDSHE